jgi:hypothetical protein
MKSKITWRLEWKAEDSDEPKFLVIGDGFPEQAAAAMAQGLRDSGDFSQVRLCRVVTTVEDVGF